MTTPTTVRQRFTVLVPTYTRTIITIPADKYLPAHEQVYEKPTGHEARDVEVEVDFAELADLLGARAHRSKRGLAVEAGGAVRVRAVRA